MSAFENSADLVTDRPADSDVIRPVKTARSFVTRASYAHEPSQAFAPLAQRQLRASWFLSIAEAIWIITVGIWSGFVYSEFAFGSPGPISSFAGSATLVAILFSASMRIVQGNRRLRSRITSLRDEAVTWTVVFMFLAFFAFSMKAGANFSRGAELTFFAVGFLAMEGFRSTAPVLLDKRYRRQFQGWSDVLLVGANGALASVAFRSEVESSGVTKCTNVSLDAACDDQHWDDELRSSVDRIFELARTSGYGEIYVSGEGIPEDRLSELLLNLQLVPRAVRLIPDPSIARLLEMPVHQVGRISTVELQRTPQSRTQGAIKRFVDLSIAVPIAVFIAPLLAVIAAAVKLSSRGPVIFRQQRLGHRSSAFEIMKFRTMTVLENDEHVVQASRDDPRVTRVGRFLRKTSLDELPQIFNVLRGEMSLVGPRPHARAHDKLYASLIENYEVRQHVKPGITGWAQVNGLRGETLDVEKMRARVEHDIWYAKNASLSLDFAILLRTALLVIRQTNAY